MKHRMMLEAAGMTDVGLVRKGNEDFIIVDEKAGLFIVADGLGGHEGGEVASRLAAETINRFFQSRNRKGKIPKSTPTPTTIDKAIQKAHEAILGKAMEDSSLRGMGTTIVVGLWREPGLFYAANIGDVRAYLLRDKKINLLTRDHSAVWELMERGDITAEEMRVHPSRNIVTRALGIELEDGPFKNSIDVRDGDILLICSDGLWDMLPDSAIERIMLEGERPEDICSRLVEAAKEAGGKDNISVIAIRAKEDMADESALIAGASRLDEAAYTELYHRYKKAIRAYIASRAFPDKSAETRRAKEDIDVDRRIREIEQLVWMDVRRRLSTYDAAKGSFYTFVCNWANFAIKRYFKEKKKKDREVPFSAFEKNGPEGEEEQVSDAGLMDFLFSQVIAIADISDEYLEKVTRLLTLTFSRGGAPHQLIAFGFNKLLAGWGPREIVKELSPSFLRNLTEELIAGYKAKSRLPAYIVNDCFIPLKAAMPKKVSQVLEDEISKRTYFRLLEAIVGGTVLKAYYGKEDPEHNITDWSDKVARRIRRLW